MSDNEERGVCDNGVRGVCDSERVHMSGQKQYVRMKLLRMWIG